MIERRVSGREGLGARVVRRRVVGRSYKIRHIYRDGDESRRRKWESKGKKQTKYTM